VKLFSATEQGDGVFLRTYRPRAKDELAFAGQRFFFQDCTATGCSAWSTDGTVAGTQPVRTLASRFPGASLEITGTFADRWLLLRSRQELYAYDAVADRVLLLLPNAGWSAEGFRDTFTAGSTLFLHTRHQEGTKYWERLWASRLDAPRASLIFTAPFINVAGWRGDLLYFASDKGRLWSTDGRRENTRPYGGIQVEVFSRLADQLGSIGSNTLIPMPGYYWGGLLAANESRRHLRMILGTCGSRYDCDASSMSKVTMAGGKAFEEINGRLWQTDGTPQGTRVHEIFVRVNPSTFRELDGRLLLGAVSREGEEELWETDGTAAGTRALSDGALDRPFGVEGAPVPLGGALLVPAVRNPVGGQLWRVAEGRATPLTSLRHLGSGIHPTDAVPLGNRTVIRGATEGWWASAEGGPAEELSAYDEQCRFYIGRSCPTPRIVAGPRLLLVMGDLWSTDGTAAGSGVVPLPYEGGGSARAAALGRLGERALVVDNLGGLWTSDGTPAGTRWITRLPADVNGGFQPAGPPASLGSLAFVFRRVPVSTDPESNAVLEVWRTDGTEAGTLRLATTPLPKSYAFFLHPVAVGGRLFFRLGGTLWVSDGSVTGTHPLQNQLPGRTFALAAGTETLYAAAGYQDNDGEHQTLWAIDPTTLAASLLGTFRQVGGGSVELPLGSVLGNTLFFQTVDDQNVERWQVTEGTPGSTHPVPGLSVSNPVAEFFTAGNRRYFTSCEDEHGCELWSTDRLGEDTRRITDLWPGSRGSDPQILAVSGDAVWFAATEPAVGRELWKIDVSAVP
jgi:ELWxxDGT repeat protein